ncbi:ABC transporter permease [candidate division CSSED10-310 bacterium]|uniref:ABC transporter permease n=1 Tax=candidate division CSSED10-310 bacterium TaxID=2855610 RepID=A0ABV6Z4U1_UNCC1
MVQRIKKMISLSYDYLGLVLALSILITIFGILARNFFTITNFQTIANQIPDITIVAVGMTFVLIIAGIDLSVGAVMALSGAVLGIMLVSYEWTLPGAIMACLATGFLCGMLNGFIVIKWSIPSFIVTLGMLEIARGTAYLVTGSRTMYIGGPVEAIIETSILGLSMPFFIALMIVLFSQVVLTRTIFGRYLVAIGTNEEAVRLSGIDPRKYKLAVFTLCGLLTSIAAIMHTARLSSANPNAGYGLELQAIAAVVIGGTSLMGGRGSIISTFFGVLIIAVLDTGLAQIGAQESTKRLITGLVIVAAVILDHYRHRK